NERVTAAWNLQIFGFYGLGFNKSDTDGAFSLPVNSYNLANEWARSQFDTRHRFNTGVNFRIPASAQGGMLARLWNYSAANTFMLFNINANSSRPYNITTGKDTNGDTSTNDRPVGVARNS